jgi:hypothetical protein
MFRAAIEGSLSLAIASAGGCAAIILANSWIVLGSSPVRDAVSDSVAFGGETCAEKSLSSRKTCAIAEANALSDPGFTSIQRHARLAVRDSEASI